MTAPRLPVEAIREQVLAHWREGGALVQSPPGSGKTTRLPLWLLEADTEAETILLLPRRLAVRLAAARLAAQLGEAVGERVGYSLRHDSRRGPRTRLTVTTYGAFLRRLLADPGLDGVGTVILDEFHERSLEQDTSLTLLHSCRALFRDDLRLLPMSATLGLNTLGRALELPSLQAEGEPHELTLHHRPPGQTPWEDHLAGLIGEARASHPGHQLVFLPGLAEIERLRRRLPADWPCRPVHGRLDQSDLYEVLDGAEPTVILSTNLAESSLTLPGVRCVLDLGLERYPEVNPVTGLTELKTRRISKSSARQRAGRAARLGPGHCYRLWSRSEEDGLAPDPPAAITQADLTPLVLALADWGLDPGEALWLTPPTPGRWAAAEARLRLWGALDDNGALTEHGRRLAGLGLDPALAQLILVGQAAGRASDALWFAALLSLGRSLPEPAETGLTAAVRDADAELKREAHHLARRAGVDLANSARPLPEDVLVRALGHRLVQRDSDGRARLASGTAVTGLGGDAPWWILLDARQRDGQVRAGQALAVSAESVRATLAERSELIYRDGRFLQCRYRGPFLLEETPGRPDARARQPAWQAWLADQPLAAWPGAERLSAWLQRYHLARAPDGDWPEPPGPEALAAFTDPWLGGLKRLEELDSRAVVQAWLGQEIVRAVDRLCPTRWQAPSGRERRLEYDADQGLILTRLKLQEAFGLTRLPSLGRGIPLTLELTAPNGRVLARVTDLPHFWDSVYPQVRKEMRGRYPRHPWPEDPWRATATSATNRQLRERENKAGG